jgi:hypothetical protein
VFYTAEQIVTFLNERQDVETRIDFVARKVDELRRPLRLLKWGKSSDWYLQDWTIVGTNIFAYMYFSTQSSETVVIVFPASHLENDEWFK